MKDISATMYNIIEQYYRTVIKDDMFRPSCGHHQVYIKDKKHTRSCAPTWCRCATPCMFLIFNVDLMMTA